MTLAAQRRIILSHQPARVVVPVPGPPASAPVIGGRVAVDVSNYTGMLKQGTLLNWKMREDVGLVIVQAIDPPPGYPAGVTRQQIEACAAAGIVTDLYLYLWTHSNVEADMRAKLALTSGLEQHIRKVWLDVEDTAPALVEERIRAVQQALAVLDGWTGAHDKPRAGIYTGGWYWRGYMGNTVEFNDRALWTSQYDGIRDPAVVTLYGGWTSCAIKQFAGTSVLSGQGGVDLNVLNDTER